MSRIANITSKNGSKYDLLPDLIAEYDSYLEDVEGHLMVKGKGLEEANVENAAWQVRYDQYRVELKTVVDFFTMEVERVRGKLFRKLKENHSRELSEREINQYINNEEAYLNVRQLQLEVAEIYEKYKNVVAAFQSRGYALNNITKIRVAQLEGVTL